VRFRQVEILFVTVAILSDRKAKSRIFCEKVLFREFKEHSCSRKLRAICFSNGCFLPPKTDMLGAVRLPLSFDRDLLLREAIVESRFQV
jgi:hypothetical protein